MAATRAPLATAVLAVSLVLFAAHAVPFAVGALAMGLDALWRRDARTVAALVPAAGLTAPTCSAGRRPASRHLRRPADSGTRSPKGWRWLARR